MDRRSFLTSLGIVGATSIIAPKAFANDENKYPHYPDPSESGGKGQHPCDYLTWEIPTTLSGKWRWAEWFKNNDQEVSDLIKIREVLYKRILNKNSMNERFFGDGIRPFSLSNTLIENIKNGRYKCPLEIPIDKLANDYSIFGNSFTGFASEAGMDLYSNVNKKITIFYPDRFNEIVFKNGIVVPTDKLATCMKNKGFTSFIIINSVPINPLGTKELVSKYIINGIEIATPAWFKSFKYLLWKQKCIEKGLDPRKSTRFNSTNNPLKRERVELGAFCANAAFSLPKDAWGYVG